ncbi:MAG: hypothetical protein ACOCRK_05170 [bacterium]
MFSFVTGALKGLSTIVGLADPIAKKVNSWIGGSDENDNDSYVFRDWIEDNDVDMEKFNRYKGYILERKFKNDVSKAKEYIYESPPTTEKKREYINFNINQYSWGSRVAADDYVGGYIELKDKKEKSGFLGLAGVAITIWKLLS